MILNISTFARGLIFSYKSKIGYLFSYGDTKSAPPYQYFYAGGIRSVRGFKQNYLGQKLCILQDIV